MFEPVGFRKQIYCIEENTCNIVEIFRCPLQSFGAPTVIRRPRNRSPFALPCYAPGSLICVFASVLKKKENNFFHFFLQKSVFKC